MERYLIEKLDNGNFYNVAEKTRKIMTSIKGKNNKTTELCFRMMLIRNGTKGWKINYNEILGKPDFYFIDERVALFIDGCYWHGCPICGHIPKTRSEFWKAKITRNQERDRIVTKENQKNGIKVLRIWEHELKNKSDRVIIIQKLNEILKARK